MFDSYHRWLGIPPAEQPPTLYRLLGLASLEADPSVIEEAADRQMAHVRTHQTGPHAAASQKLLNELSAAKLTLLDADRKAAYDRTLRPSSPPPLPTRQIAKPPMPAAIVRPPLARPLPVVMPVMATVAVARPVVEHEPSPELEYDPPRPQRSQAMAGIICEHRTRAADIGRLVKAVAYAAYAAVIAYVFYAAMMYRLR